MSPDSNGVDLLVRFAREPPAYIALLTSSSGDVMPSKLSRLLAPSAELVLQVPLTFQ